MQFLWAFLVGGAICVVGQLMFDVVKLTPAHTMATLVVIGAVLDGIGLYDPLVDFAGAGATVPITSFGNALVHGALTSLREDGYRPRSFSRFLRRSSYGPKAERLPLAMGQTL